MTVSLIVGYRNTPESHTLVDLSRETIGREIGCIYKTINSIQAAAEVHADVDIAFITLYNCPVPQNKFDRCCVAQSGLSVLSMYTSAYFSTQETTKVSAKQISER